MECLLPTWVSHVAALFVIAVAGGSALWVIERCSQSGRQRHPAMTFGDQHSRNLWGVLGVFLGVFLVFPVAGWATLDMTQGVLCRIVGEWQETHPPPVIDFDAMQREIDSLLGRH